MNLITISKNLPIFFLTEFQFGNYQLSCRTRNYTYRIGSILTHVGTIRAFVSVVTTHASFPWRIPIADVSGEAAAGVLFGINVWDVVFIGILLQNLLIKFQFGDYQLVTHGGTGPILAPRDRCILNTNIKVFD